MTWLIAAFLIAHGAVHLAIWLTPPPDAEHPAPFAPDHSAVLTRTQVPHVTAHLLAVRLAGAAAIAYVAAGLAVALSLGSGWTAALAGVAAVIGLALKFLFFNPWLSLGVLLDAAVFSAAALGWPFGLT